jgi:hypothetical protein
MLIVLVAGILVSIMVSQMNGDSRVSFDASMFIAPLFAILISAIILIIGIVILSGGAC